MVKTIDHDSGDIIGILQSISRDSYTCMMTGMIIIKGCGSIWFRRFLFVSSGAIFDLYSSVIWKYYRVEIVFIWRHEIIYRKLNTIFDMEDSSINYSWLTLISQQVGFLEKFHSKLEKFHSNLEKFHSKLEKFHSTHLLWNDRSPNSWSKCLFQNNHLKSTFDRIDYWWWCSCTGLFRGLQ